MTESIYILVLTNNLKEYDDLYSFELPITEDSLIRFSNKFGVNLTIDELLSDWSLVSLIVEDKLFLYIVDTLDIEKINYIASLFNALPPEAQQKYLDSIDEDRNPRYNLDELISLAKNINEI